MSKEEKIVDWIISSMIYSLTFLAFIQCGLAFFLVGLYVDKLLYIVISIGWWILAAVALALIRRKLKHELTAI